MDIVFQKGTQEKFNTTIFEEGNVCFVKQINKYDYLYRIEKNNLKIPLLGFGYELLGDNCNIFKISKDVFNCNDKITVGEMVNFSIEEDGTKISWTMPSIKAIWSERDGVGLGNTLVFDVADEKAGRVAPNPNKIMDLGAKHARWSTLFLGAKNQDGLYEGTINSKKNLTILCEDDGYITFQTKSNTEDYNNNIKMGYHDYIGFKNIFGIIGGSVWKDDGVVQSRVLTLDVHAYKTNLNSGSDNELIGYICPVTNRNGLTNLGGPALRWSGLYLSDKINIDTTPPPIYDDNAIFQPTNPSYQLTIGEKFNYNSYLDIPSIIGGNFLNDIYGNILILDVASDSLYSQKNDNDVLVIASLPGVIGPHPDRTGLTSLGAPAMRWNNIYFSGVLNGTAAEVTQAYVDGDGITSDKRLKEIQPNEILQKDLLLYDTLIPVCYKYKNISPDHNYSRTHIGFLAQDVENQIKNFELSSEDCALVQARPLNEDDSQELKDICTDGYKYYLNYNELHGLHTLKNHQQDNRLTALEEKNQELENTISNLKTQIELLKLAMGG